MENGIIHKSLVIYQKYRLVTICLQLRIEMYNYRNATKTLKLLTHHLKNVIKK